MHTDVSLPLDRSRPRRPARWAMLAIAAAAAGQLGATDCGGGITRDPGFDLWCGEALCAWKLERGDIRRAPTWHEADAGVELLATDTAIEQFTPVNSRDGTCIRFDLISDVAETAQAELAVDVYGDGVIERTFEIPTAHWRAVSFAFAVRAPYTGIRFEITKRGPGRAVIARMRAALAPDGCNGVPELDGGPAPVAALCKVNGDCASGICSIVDFFGAQRCTACDLAHATCGTGQVCGYGEPGVPERAVPIECVAAGARELGEQCLRDGECASGICTGFCSTCRPGAAMACGAGECRPAYPGLAAFLGPYLCDAGLHRGAPGAPCASDGDCASSACNGAVRRQCSDGRVCATDANCPVEAGLKPGACSIVGIQGGSCS